MTLRAVVGIGSSHPRGAELIQRAVLFLDSQKCIKVAACSKLHKNAAQNMPFAVSYVNAAAAIETSLPPDALWLCLHKVEFRLGRMRLPMPYIVNRSMDLDVHWYSGPPQRSIFLTIPHPGLKHRVFAQRPFKEVTVKLGWKDAIAISRVRNFGQSQT